MRPDLTRFARFLLTSGVAAFVNVATGWLLGFIMAYTWAVTLAFAAGMVTAFLLARRFVFASAAGAVRGQFIRFALVNAIAFAQVWLISVGLARVIFPAIGYRWQGDTVAHIIGVASPAITSYLLHQRFSFRIARI